MDWAQRLRRRLKHVLVEIVKLLGGSIVFIPAFTVMMVGAFPIILVIFVGSHQLFSWFTKWYLTTTPPSLWQYVAGYTIGASLFAAYVYAGVFRDEELDDVVRHLVVVSAFVISSLRWVPAAVGVSIPKFTGGVLGYLYSLPLTAIIGHAVYLNKQQKEEENEEIEPREGAAVTNVLAFKAAKSVMKKVKRHITLRAADALSEQWDSVVSIVYLSAIMGVVTYIIEMWFMPQVRLLWFLLIAVNAPVALVVFLFREHIMEWAEEELEKAKRNIEGESEDS